MELQLLPQDQNWVLVANKEGTVIIHQIDETD